MPFYEYINDGPPGCGRCHGAFVLLQKLSEDPLAACPECGSPLRRLISAPNLVGHPTDDLKPSKIEQAGFTQYRRIGKGVYEKSAGKGPGIISAD